MLREDGSLCSLEHELYKKWFALIEENATPLSAILYVDTDPKTCLERIAKRGRTGEESIPLEYLQSLDKTQRAWVENTSVPVLNVTGFPSASEVGKFIDSLNPELEDAVKEHSIPSDTKKISMIPALRSPLTELKSN